MKNVGQGSDDELNIEKETMTAKSKKRAVKVFFGRTMIILLLILLQLGFFVAVNVFLVTYKGFLFYLMNVFRIAAMIFVVNESIEPNFKITWLVLIAVFPIFGVLFYLFVKLQPGTRMLNRKITNVIRETKGYLKQDADVMKNLTERAPLTSRFARYMSDYAGFPVYENTEAQYFPLGEQGYEEIKRQILWAKQFIFLEFFIIAPGKMWDEILDILTVKASQGIEVRVIYDGTCSFNHLPHDYPKELEKRGIKCHVFSPIKPLLSSYQNNRDHRKILIVDGIVAFTGGINLADEYINEKVRFGHWKDTNVMIHGDAVMSFTLMFLQIWDIYEEELDDFDRYICRDMGKTPHYSDGFVLPYSDSPLDDERVGEEVYLNMIHTASDYVHIMTPYFILDHEMTDTFLHAGKKGMDIKVIVPHVPDKWYALALAKTYFEDLIRAGVKIYEYTPGFVHAKVFVSDDKRASVGTVNLDYRSLYLHFECGCYFYRNDVIRNIEADFQQTLKSCRQFRLEDLRKRPWYEKAVGRLLRIIAPLM